MNEKEKAMSDHVYNLLQRFEGLPNTKETRKEIVDTMMGDDVVRSIILLHLLEQREVI